MLTGDMERGQEALLVAEHGGGPQSDMLIAPRRGRRASSSAISFDAVVPKIAVFQAGYRNRFGRPACDVLERYRVRGITIVVSPTRCGAMAGGRTDGRLL